MLTGIRRIILANVRSHRHRTAGAMDAGEGRASASDVTAGRCSVDCIVSFILFVLIRIMISVIFSVN
jgi:hypothetical protein